ncbi:MAG: hypothetical protein QOH47_2381 [Sphingomonadales bacterium]|nr:hypothetical protein [Sphingomonadales bacterium]
MSGAPAVEALLARQFGTRAFTYVTTLRGKHADGGLDADSLDLVQLAVNIENRFEINVADDDVEKVETVGDVIALVNRKVAARPQPNEDERNAARG